MLHYSGLWFLLNSISVLEYRVGSYPYDSEPVYGYVPCGARSRGPWMPGPEVLPLRLSTHSKKEKCRVRVCGKTGSYVSVSSEIY